MPWNSRVEADSKAENDSLGQIDGISNGSTEMAQLSNCFSWNTLRTEYASLLEQRREYYSECIVGCVISMENTR